MPNEGEKDRAHEAPAQPAVVQASAHSPRTVGESNFHDGTTEVNVGHPDFRSTARAGPQGSQQTFQGTGGAQGEEDDLEVCESLRGALNRGGGTWQKFMRTEHVDEIDAFSTDKTGKRLNVQVTRVERTAWAQLARSGAASARQSVDVRVGVIRTAIGDKSQQLPGALKANLVLALDAIRAPGHVETAVVEAFKGKYQQWAAAQGFDQVWLVGPTDRLTYRLD
jgi:hypothetical protein